MIENAVKKSVTRIRSGRELDSFDKVDDWIIFSVGDYNICKILPTNCVQLLLLLSLVS